MRLRSFINITDLIKKRMAKRRTVRRFYDSGQENRTTLQNITFVLAYAINIIQLGLVFYELSFAYQETRTQFTYQRPTDEPCTLFYDLGLNRGFYLVFAINILDIKCAINIGNELGGLLCTITSAASTFINSILLTICVFYYNISCNKDGFGNRQSVCNNEKFCGIEGVYNKTINDCNNTNPFQKPLSPTIGLSDLTWDPQYLTLVIILITMTILSALKTVFNIIQPTTLGNIQNIQSAFNQLSNTNQGSNLISNLSDFISKKPSGKTSKFVNLYEERKSFFTYWRSWHVPLFVLTLALDVFVTILFIAWFGWFAQNIESVITRYEINPMDANTTIVTTRYIWFNYIYYAMIGLNILWITLTSRLGQFFTNAVAVIGAGMGATTCFILLLIGLLYFGLSCNQDGQPFNICNNRCHYCRQFFANPVNSLVCKNMPCTKDCPYRQGTCWFGICFNWGDIDFLILMGILAISTFSYVMTLITGIILQMHFRYVRDLVRSKTRGDVRKGFAMIGLHIDEPTEYDDKHTLNEKEKLYHLARTKVHQAFHSQPDFIENMIETFNVAVGYSTPMDDVEYSSTRLKKKAYKHE